ncbi:hypothetical protein [Sporichthya sp.]|uniref:hypothetical protein n=1 Tax=Sporichthya sp. TaxID=65475 RepID=UPI0017EFE816|nr:hypothetical protein [Sporichthya sp.]MBA3742122.1 hypothetical protein [Sporichthya sp.]
MTQSGTATGEWVPVRLADGSWRYDWQPAEQPPSPDGTSGVWRLVPGAVDGYGSWVWFPAPPPPGAHPAPPMAPGGDLGAPLRSRRTAVAVGLSVVLALVFFLMRDGGSDEPTGTSALPGGQKQSLLLTAATNYTSALVAGKGAEAAAFLDPQVCRANDREEVAELAAFFAKSAPGATVKVTSVDVNGDDGNVTGYEFSAGFPAEVRAVMDQGYTSGGEFAWHLRGEKWYFDAECWRAGR